MTCPRETLEGAAMIRVRETLEGAAMIRVRETAAFERYIDFLWAVIFIIACKDVSPDSLAYNQYSARVDERHFELMLDFFGNLDAPL